MIIKSYLISLKNILVVTMIFFSMSASAQNVDRLLMDSLRNSFIQYRDSASAEFNDYKRRALEEYAEYLEQARADYEAWQRSVKQTWGEEEGIPVESTKTVWVEYSPDHKNRSVVDFDQGNVTVEVVLSDDEKESDIDAGLTAAIERMLNSRGTTCPYPSSVDRADPLTVNPVLDGLLNLSDYKIEDEDINDAPKIVTPPRPKVRGKNLGLDNKRPATPVIRKPPVNKDSLSSLRKENNRKQIALKNAKRAKAIAKQSKKVMKKIVGNDGKSRKVVQVQMAMVSDNLSKNAALYKDIVAEFSAKFNIEQPLIFAVMEQESRFNPEAVSPANACGLMQLVATSGGMDAYRFVYGTEWVPTRSYLFDPRNNIELGTAYLRVLTNQFNKVSDDDCRRLCVIAGYNTGAGNVSRAFTGKRNVNTAVPHINEHSYNSLYNHLTTNLSTEEARNYVSGVSKRREKYLKL